MKRRVIHTEQIKKQGTKIQFQIKLPRTSAAIKGIEVTATQRSPAEEGAESNSLYAGWITLRIPEKRDVFYSGLIRFERPVEEQLSYLSQLGLGIGTREEWWLGGTKREHFAVNIPIENTIIEGYFEDHADNRGQDYTVRIYLALEDDKKQ